MKRKEEMEDKKYSGTTGQPKNAEQRKDADKTKLTEETERAQDENLRDIYDRIAKRCLSLSARCTIKLINGLFGTDYPIDSDVQYNWTENVDDGLKKTLSDTIITINGNRSYHCEFQMTKDGEMILRMLEYGLHHAVKSREGIDVLEFPEPVIVYLYDENLPEEYKICIRFGTQGEYIYKVPVFRYLKRTGESEKTRDELIVLLPFQLLRLRRAIEKKRTKENREALQKIITNDIVKTLERNVAAGNITKIEKDQIIAMTMRLYEHIYGKYAQEMPEVEKMMSDALVLKGDEYYYQVRTLEEKIREQNRAHKKEMDEKDAQLKKKDAQLEKMAAQLQDLTRRLAEVEARTNIVGDK